MLGPVVRVEWNQACRGGRHHLVRTAYSLLLIAEVALFLYSWAARSYLARLAQRMHTGDVAAELAWEYFEFFIAQHFVLLLLVTPALAGGSLADEKTRGTLTLVLTSRLTSADVVLGKWLAHAGQVVLLALPVAPLVVFVLTLGDVHPGTLITWGAETLVVAGSLAAAALLASVWARRTTTAVLAVYLTGALLLGAAWAVGAGGLLRHSSLMQARNQLAADTWWHPQWFVTLAAVALAGGACLALAVWRLRPAYAAQLTAARRPGKVAAWFRRPPVSDAPLRWKERYVGELGLLAFARRVPRWLLLAAVGALGFWGSVLALGDDTAALLHGLGLILAAGLIVAVRASGVVSSERERQTWDSLLLTPLEPYHLVRGKLWGVIDGVRPYLVAYLVPALAVALFDGIWPAFCLALCWVATWGVLYYLAAQGLFWSVRLSSSWRSLLYTLTSAAYAIFIRTLLMAAPVIAIVFSLASIAYYTLSMFFPGPIVWLAVVLVAGLGPAVIHLFAYAEELLQAAEKHVRRTERVQQEVGPDLVKSLTE